MNGKTEDSGVASGSCENVISASSFGDATFGVIAHLRFPPLGIRKWQNQTSNGPLVQW